MEDNTLTSCKNCEQDIETSFEFCPHCGQKTKEDLTIGVLFYNTISNYFSFDARFFKSFIPLMLRPGLLAKRFIGGKRLLYLHPAQMYLFISVLFFFLFSFVSRDFIQKTDEVLEKGFNTEATIDSLESKKIDSATVAKITEPLKNSAIVTGMSDEELKKLDSVIVANSGKQSIPDFTFDFDKKKLDSLIAIDAPEEEQLTAMGMNKDAGLFKRRLYTQMLKIQKQSGKGILQAFIDSIPISMFMLLPIFAMILKLFFWRRGRFAHHLVFSFYFFSFLFTVFSIILLSKLIWEIPDWISWLIVFSTIFYLFLAVKHFYGQNYFVSFFKTGFVAFFYTIFVIPIAIGIMIAGTFLLY